MQLLETPNLQPELTEFTNNAVGTARAASVVIGGQSFQMTFISPGECTRRTNIEVDVGGRSCCVAISNPSVFDCLNEVTGGTEIERLPQDLQPAVLAAAFDQTINEIAAITGVAWNVGLIAKEMPASELRLALRLQAANGKTTNIEIVFDEDLRSVMVKLTELVPVAEVLPVDDLTFTADVEIGATELSIDELKSLQAGDVVVLDEREDVVLRFGDSIVVMGAIEDNALRVSSVTALPAKEPDERGDDIPVTVSVCRGAMTLTAAALTNLRPADILPVSDIDRPARLVAGRNSISDCEIVRVGSRVGAKIVDPAEVTCPGSS